METIILKCRFCGKETGKIEQTHILKPISDKGILDTRCSDCEALYGTFKEIEEHWRFNVKKKEDTYENFKDLVAKSNYKIGDFINNNKLKEEI